MPENDATTTAGASSHGMGLSNELSGFPDAKDLVSPEILVFLGSYFSAYEQLHYAVDSLRPPSDWTLNHSKDTKRVSDIVVRTWVTQNAHIAQRSRELFDITTDMGKVLQGFIDPEVMCSSGNLSTLAEIGKKYSNQENDRRTWVASADANGIVIHADNPEQQNSLMEIFWQIQSKIEELHQPVLTSRIKEITGRPLTYREAKSLLGSTRLVIHELKQPVQVLHSWTRKSLTSGLVMAWESIGPVLQPNIQKLQELFRMGDELIYYKTQVMKAADVEQDIYTYLLEQITQEQRLRSRDDVRCVMIKEHHANLFLQFDPAMLRFLAYNIIQNIGRSIDRRDEKTPNRRHEPPEIELHTSYNEKNKKLRLEFKDNGSGFTADMLAVGKFGVLSSGWGGSAMGMGALSGIIEGLGGGITFDNSIKDGEVSGGNIYVDIPVI